MVSTGHSRNKEYDISVAKYVEQADKRAAQYEVRSNKENENENENENEKKNDRNKNGNRNRIRSRNRIIY
jgi:hypothetical protein